MPDLYKDEETETRTLSLCLFDVAGITVLNRCANCPGAARAALQHRRCPREPLQPNIFRPEEPDSKISAALKSLASSSKQRESGHHVAVTVLPDSLARLSLIDSDGTDEGTFGRSESDPDIPGGRAEPSGTPLITHGGVKRKAKSEDLEESISLAKSKYKRNEFDHLSVQDYFKLKPQKPIRDSESLFMPGCLHIPSDEMTALLMNSSSASPMDTQEDHPSREASSSRPFVAGCCINTELDGCGLLACDDGIEGVLACPDEMEI